MKKYKYVVVSGCSFSASGESSLVNSGETYGDLIAEYFGAKFYNFSLCGGSLQRMNRKILEWCSKNTDKFKDTLILFGMTSLGRLEIWSNGQYEALPGPSPGWYNDCHYLQTDPQPPDTFKIDWPLEKRKKWFINFYNDNAQFFLASNIIIGLQSFLTLNNIDHVFFDAIESTDKFWERHCDDMQDILGHKLIFDNLVSQENWYKHPEYESMSDFTHKNLEMGFSKTDNHPSKKAHKYWSECLMEFIDEKINI